MAMALGGPYEEAGPTLEKNLERWMELCEQAAKEKDPKKLTELTTEICRLLDEKKKCSHDSAAETKTG